MGYVSDTARTRTHNVFRQHGHSDGFPRNLPQHNYAEYIFSKGVDGINYKLLLI